MGGFASSAKNAVSSAVNTVVDAGKSIVEKPLQGAVKAVTLPAAIVVEQAAAFKDVTAGIPIVGDITKGAGAAANSLNAIEQGRLPNNDDLKALAAAGGAAMGVTGDTGMFNFDSFMDTFNQPAPSKPAPGRSSSNNYFIQTPGEGFAPPPSSFGAIVLFAGIGLAGFFLLRSKI